MDMHSGIAEQHQVATGGKNLYGIPLGILMLQTRFPRIPGDVGHASTWPFPVMYKVVANASPDAVVRKLADDEWLEPFAAAAQELEQAGVALITTGCGFLVLFQEQLQRRLRVPLLASSLLQVPWVASILPPDRRIGILTVEARSLTERHLRSAGIADIDRLTVLGMEEVGGHFTRQLLDDLPELDVARCREEHVRAAQLLLQRDPDIGAIVLECTNMPPYADLIRATTGLPVYDLTTLVRWAVMGVTAGSMALPASMHPSGKMHAG